MREALLVLGVVGLAHAPDNLVVALLVFWAVCEASNDLKSWRLRREWRAARG